MRQYNILQPVYLAFYSKDLYRDVGKEWPGMGFSYFLLLSLICFVPFIHPETLLLQIQLAMSKFSSAAHEEQVIVSWFTAYTWWGVAFVYGMLFGLFYLRGVIEILVCGLLAKCFVVTPLSYKQLCRLAAVATTPGMLLSTLFGFLPINFSYRWLIYFAVTLAYLFYAIEANRHHEEKNKPV